MASASSSSSHWWLAFIYMAATAALIFAVISSSRNQESREDQGGDLILALHQSGFHLTAHHLLHSSSPSLRPSSSSPFTLFALPDSFLSDSDAELLLLRHVIPLYRLPFSSLPPNASFPTLLPGLDLSFDPSLVSHPDLLVRGPHVAHGISRPFPLPLLNWDPVLRTLQSKGYASFSRSLSASAAAVLECCKYHGTKIKVTVFAAREWEEGGDVRRHVAVGRYGYWEVREMEVEGVMRSLCGESDEDGEDHNIRVTDHNGVMEVNGVVFVESAVYVDDRIIVHGIATAFLGPEMAESDAMIDYSILDALD